MWPFGTYPELTPDGVAYLAGYNSISKHGHDVYDYIIVGGGTAGCVLASRLSEDPSTRVLVVERGRAASSWKSRVPLLSTNLSRPYVPAHQWDAQPLQSVGGRVLPMVIGRALGGTSRINSMVYSRGFASEYDRWSKSGRNGWSYDDVLPYFMKSEGRLGCDSEEAAHHGTRGPWHNKPWATIYSKSSEKALDAAKSLGFHSVNDINAPNVPIVGVSPISIMHDEKSRRSSMADAFLPTALAIKRKNRLKICTGSIVTSIGLEPVPGGGCRAAGVFIEGEAFGKTFYARARKEIILCCGAIGSPQLLMLSGIGPKKHLKDMGITVQKDLPGVGSHLQDHPRIITTYRVPMQDSLRILEVSFIRMIIEFIKYVFLGTGLFLYPIAQFMLIASSKFITDDAQIVPHTLSQLDSRQPDNIPDIEIVPVTSGQPGGSDSAARPKDGLFSFAAFLLQPRSGTVRLQSNDPRASPLCDLDFFKDAKDYEVARKALKLCKRLAENMRRDGYRIAEETVPRSESDEDLDAFAREQVISGFHYTSTCRMAPEHDPEHPGVVDDELRVYGVQGLRVADCSVFPNITAGHPQAPAVMVAEKCADMILTASPAAH
ncbi:hypothetical protein BOTBODRAFT_35593 [Botryobasidium botryosum FD-172 SS1]|uniref:Glucose-methanol-choline oxidoreductase N-terminal domain-containing protein n=1 Tax=Botryobasidium botryosum (strain FD-172 SS1) TaxID=930990 RepID=A0A067M665_BOTB1|nr:hypothetical protein BOTBODRAFT_35593 [Botryobasidium botryosum FD-172 SS1]